MGDPQVPSYMRVEPGSVNIPFGKWPNPPTSADIDADGEAKKVVEKFNQALSSKDVKGVVSIFLEDSYWRDHLVNSWDYRTLKGPSKIEEFLQSGLLLEKIEINRGSAFRAPHVTAFDGGDTKGIEFFIDFESTIGRGEGLIRLAEKDGEWKIWNFYVVLKELKGFEEPLGQRRANGVTHGADKGRKNWKDKRTDALNFVDSEPVVLIVGAGQAGLTAAARLKMLNVPTLAIDKNDNVGDNWRSRYQHLVLHDPIWYDHMPYIPFPNHWPVFTPKDKLGGWFEAYAKSLELNIWTKTRIESSSWDDNKRQWTVTLNRTKEDGTTEKRTFHPRHVIQATGHSGKKNFPDIKGMDGFKGTRLVHSSEFTGALDDSRGKKAIVVGACNSSHDICQDYYEKGYDVTMVQRSSTCVVSSEAICGIALKGVYDQDSPPVDDSDVWLFAYPGEIFKSLQANVVKLQQEHDQETLEGLAKAGFQLDKGIDDAGLFVKYYFRGGGYYIDVGASQLIVEGKVKVKSGQEITEILPNGMKFADGTELEADEIIFATGYQNMRTEARTIFGDDVYNRVKSIWGFDEEGEFRTIWRNSGHPGFWFMGGNLALCRYYSRLLALQIKGLEEGLYTYNEK